MKLRTLRNYLRDIYQDGSACWTLHFSDQDCYYYTITDVYEDEDGDICLEAGDGYEHSAGELYDELRGYPNDAYVYVYAPADDYYFDIEGGWYWDDDCNLTMDMHYNYDDDDDDDYYDDDEGSYIEKEWTSNECPKCGSSNIDSRYSFDTDKVLYECLNCGFKYVSDN